MNAVETQTHREALARRARMGMPPARPVNIWKPKLPVETANIGRREKPTIKVVQYYDQHVKDWRRYVSNSATFFVRRRAKELGFSLREVFAKDRRRGICRAKHIIRYELHMTGKYSLAEIAKYTGRVDHTTAMHSINVVKEMIDRGEYVPQVAG